MPSWRDQEHTMEVGDQARHKDTLVTKDCKFSVHQTREMVTPDLPASGMSAPNHPIFFWLIKKKSGLVAMISLDLPRMWLRKTPR